VKAPTYTYQGGLEGKLYFCRHQDGSLRHIPTSRGLQDRQSVLNEENVAIFQGMAKYTSQKKVEGNVKPAAPPPTCPINNTSKFL
jgi:hypothetical protein